MRVIVTGGGGFVGSHIIDRLLDRGYSVRSIGRSPQPILEAKGVEVIFCDIADAKAVQQACCGMNAVIHTAAKAGIWGSWESYYQPNVLGTRNILNACRAERINRLVYTSTPSVVFNRKPIRNGDESMPYGSNWLCHYAHSKAIAEKEVLDANHSNLKTIVLRPHLIWGPEDPHLLPRVVESALSGRLKIVGKGDNRVDVSHIDNVADAHMNALDAIEKEPACGRAYFISDGEPVELWLWINSILERLGIPPIKRTVPLGIAYTAGAIFEVLWKISRQKKDPPMTRFVAIELAKDHYFDISAARRELGYKPNKVSEIELMQTVDYLKKHCLK